LADDSYRNIGDTPVHDVGSNHLVVSITCYTYWGYRGVSVLDINVWTLVYIDVSGRDICVLEFSAKNVNVSVLDIILRRLVYIDVSAQKGEPHCATLKLFKSAKCCKHYNSNL